ncbi:MAG: DUF481 domain-containing protein [Planctomycetota bacterium]
MIRQLTAIAAAALASLALAQQAQPAPQPARTAAELLERLRAAGVELPEGVTVNDDGTVSVPVPTPPEQAQPDQAQPQQAAPPTTGTPPADAAEGLPAADAPAVAAPAPKPVDWNRRLEASLNYAEGNSENLSFRFAGRAKRTSERSELTLNAQYFYATADGEETDDSLFVTALYDYSFAKYPRLLTFVEFRYDYDEFESFLHRTALSGGLGYKIIDREKLSLIGRGGITMTREFGSSRNEIIPEALAGFDLDWQLTERQELNISHRTFFDLLEGGEFRSLTIAGWTLALDELGDGFNLNVGIQHEYQSEVDPGFDRNDIQLFAGVGWDF